MSDLILPWKKITRGLSKGRKYADDRPPTIEQIRRIIQYLTEGLKHCLHNDFFRHTPWSIGLPTMGTH